MSVRRQAAGPRTPWNYQTQIKCFPLPYTLMVASTKQQKTIRSKPTFSIQQSRLQLFSEPVRQWFLGNSVNAASCIGVWLMTTELLTERRAGWHAGRPRPRRLRGGPEIALLLHYSITSQLTSPTWLPLHHATAEMSWDGNNWTRPPWVTHPSRQQGKHSGDRCSTQCPASSNGMMVRTSQHHTSCTIKINAPQPIRALLVFLLLFPSVTDKAQCICLHSFWHMHCRNQKRNLVSGFPQTPH